jgi:hypothetical protein
MDTLLNRFVKQQSAADDMAYRGLYNSEARLMAKEHPWGVGFGNFSAWSWYRYAEQVDPDLPPGTPAHNNWYLNLGAAFTVVGGAATPFILLMNKSLGLDLQQIGWINGGAALITLPAFFVAGFLIDRWNVVKIMFYGRLLQTLVTAGFLVFLFADLTPRQVLTVTVVLNLLLLIVTAILLVATLPMQMRLLPRERYGQFTSAMSVTVGVAGIVAGALMGGFIDGMRYVHHGSDFALRYAPLWLTCFYGAATYMQYRVHRHVQAVCGGNLSAFVPPDTSEIPESSLARACEPLTQENEC